MFTVKQEEYVNKIRSQYEVRKETKLEELRRLDKSAKLPAKVFSYAIGVIGALAFGAGMCLTMKVIGATLPFAIPLGAGIGILGVVMVSVNYFIYKAIFKRRKRKYAGRVIELSDELLHK